MKAICNSCKSWIFKQVSLESNLTFHQITPIFTLLTPSNKESYSMVSVGRRCWLNSLHQAHTHHGQAPLQMTGLETKRLAESRLSWCALLFYGCCCNICACILASISCMRFSSASFSWRMRSFSAGITAESNELCKKHLKKKKLQLKTDLIKWQGKQRREISTYGTFFGIGAPLARRSDR